VNHQVFIEPLSDERLSQAWPIWLSAGWNEAYQLSQQAFITSWQASPVKLGVFIADQLVGIARANTDGVLYAMIHDVVIAPDHRGQGHGKRLVKELVASLRARGVRSIQLMAAQGQAPFYLGLGFQSRPKDGPGMTFSDLAPS